MAPTTLCDVYCGARGTSFTRDWLPTFLSLCVGITDDSGESIATNIAGLDEGSPGNPIPAVDPAAAAHVLLRDQKRRSMYKARNNKAFALFYQHITDRGYRERLDAFVRDAAAQQPPVNARTGPVAQAVALEWFASPHNAIQLQQQNTEWSNLTMHQIGITDNTPRWVYARLLTMNTERTPAQRFNQAGIVTKFLSVFTFPESLQQRALEEMTNPTIGLFQPDLMLRTNLVVTHFQSLWEAYFKQGIIKPSPARAAPTLQNHRVDGFEFETKHVQDSNPAHYCVPSEQDADSDGEFVYEAKFTSGPRKGEIICWNCLGAGHPSRTCTSKKVKRNKDEHMQRLAASGGDVTITRSRKPPPRHRPPNSGPRSRFATPPGKPKFEVRLVDAEPLSDEESGDEAFDECEESDYEIQMNDIKSLFSLECLPEISDSEEADFHIEGLSHSDAVAKVYAGLDIREIQLARRCADSETCMNEYILAEIRDLRMARQMLDDATEQIPALDTPDSSDSLIPVMEGPTLILSEPQPEQTTPIAPPATSVAPNECFTLLPFLLFSLQLYLYRYFGNMARKIVSLTHGYARCSQFSLVLFVVLAYAATGLCSPMRSFSLLSLEADMSAPGQKFTYYNVCPDTGASRSASPKRALFPNTGIQDRNPKMRVRVANGCHLKVEFIGTMIIKAKCDTTSSAKKFIILPIKSSLYVPGLHTSCILPLSAHASFSNFRGYPLHSMQKTAFPSRTVTKSYSPIQARPTPCKHLNLICSR